MAQTPSAKESRLELEPESVVGTNSESKAVQPTYVIEAGKLLISRPKDLWAYRELFLLLVKRDFVAVYKQTVLGPFWFFVQPFLASLVFIVDVPVKNYSSGMYVRLAFSVAAHLNPEIVILDEVLAVGDTVFQKKCFDRMEEIIDEGHAAILVSHGMGHMRRMCQVCLWLRHGRIEMFVPTHEVASAYDKETTQEVVSHYEQTTQPHEGTQPEASASLAHWSEQSKLSVDPHTIVCGQAKVALRFEIEMRAFVPNCKIAVSPADAEGLILLTHADDLRLAKIGKISMVLDLPMLPLRAGEYILACTISNGSHPVEKSLEASGYHGLLNLPAKLSVLEVEKE